MDSANLYNVHQQNPHVVLPLQFPSCLASSHDPSWDHNSLLNHEYQENSVQGVQMFNRDPTELDLNSMNMVEHHLSVAPFSFKNHPGLELNTSGNHSDNYSDYARINEELELDSARNFHGLQIPSADQLFPHPAISSNYLVSPQASDGATLSAQQSPVANFCYEETITSVNGNPHEMEYLRRLNSSYSPLEITTRINSYQNKRNRFVNEASAKNRTNCIPQSKGIQRACKRQRLDTSNPTPPLKVRKEKLSDKISALQQLVSPFGKVSQDTLQRQFKGSTGLGRSSTAGSYTDTASVLKEAIGYIHFLHNQVETLSVPYLKPSSTHTSTIRTMHGVDPYETCSTLQYRAAEEEKKKKEGHFKDLRSRGLCLVPTSMMSHLANDNVAALWPRPSFGPP